MKISKGAKSQEVEYLYVVNPFHSGCLQTGTLANREETDEMLHRGAFHQYQHCLQK